MVVQRTLDNLKDKPHDEKKAVAGGIAIAIVVILLVGWGFLFLRKIQSGGDIPSLEGSTVPEDQLNAAFIKQTQEQLTQYYQSSQEQLRGIRDDAAGSDASVDAGAGVSAGGSGDDFGAQNNDF